MIFLSGFFFECDKRLYSMGIIPVSCCASSHFHVAELSFHQKIKRRTVRPVQKCQKIPQIPRKRKQHIKVILSADSPTSTNLFKPHDSPLRFIAITSIDRAALSLLISALPSLFGLSSSPLADLVFTFLAARLGDRRRRSEANAVDAFAVVTQSSVDLMSGNLGVLPGRVAEVGRDLAAVW